jgi:hypothetical protein
MYKELLTGVAEWMKENSLQMQPPGRETDIEDARARARAVLGAELPEEYCRLLRETDGLDANGLVLYATRTSPIAGHHDRFITGIVEANEGWRDLEDNRNYLFFGDSGMSLFAYHLGEKRYQILDRSSGSLIEAVQGFDELVARALEENRPNE